MSSCSISSKLSDRHGSIVVPAPSFPSSLLSSLQSVLQHQLGQLPHDVLYTLVFTHFHGSKFTIVSLQVTVTSGLSSLGLYCANPTAANCEHFYYRGLGDAVGLRDDRLQCTVLFHLYYIFSRAAPIACTRQNSLSLSLLYSTSAACYSLFRL